MVKKDSETINRISLVATHVVYGLIGFVIWAVVIFPRLGRIRTSVPGEGVYTEFPTTLFWSAGTGVALVFGLFGPMIYRYYSDDERGRGRLGDVKGRERRRR